MKENFEKSQHPIEKTNEDKILNAREDFSYLKKKAVEAKDKGEYADPHFNFIRPGSLGLEEAELWQQMKDINSLKEYEAFVEELNKYKQTLERRGFIKIDSPEMNFAAFLSNKVMGIYLDLMKKESR